MKIRAIIILSLAFMLSARADAQDKKTVLSNVRTFVASTAPEHKLDITNELGDDLGDNAGAYAWKSDKNYLVVMVTSRPTFALTQSDFEGEPDQLRVHSGFDVIVPDEKVFGLGDDNHFIERPNVGDTELAFRKGVYLVRIWASSRNFAKDIAWNIVPLIPDA